MSHTWEQLMEEKHPSIPKMVSVCDCNTTIVQVTPNAEGLCPLCGYYAFKEPEWNVKASITKRKGKRHNVRIDGIELRGRKYNLIKAHAAIELHKSGLTLQKIAEQLDIGVSSVHKYIHDRRGKV